MFGMFAFKRVNGKSQLGLFHIALFVLLFVLGSFVGVCGSLFGLIGTQAMSGRESAFEIFSMIGIWHFISWGVCGLIVAAGFLGVTTGRRRLWLVVTVLSGFVGGGVIGALILTALMRTGVRFNFYDAIVLEVLVPPSIGLAMVVLALYIARTLDNANACDSTQE